jgi:acyl-CoA thioester hydrolase
MPEANRVSHQTTHRLRFNDTDKLGHVNNAVFAVMLEQGRSELLFETGLPMGEGPQAVVIVRLELDFVAEMRWPGEVLIDTVVTRLGGKSFNFRQTLASGGVLCARADTVLVVMDRGSGKSVPIDSWREALAVWLEPGQEARQTP